MRRRSWIVAWILTLFWHAHASADWLSLRGSCPGTQEQVALRIEQELAGERPAALSVTLELEAGTPVRGSLRLHRDATSVGAKHVLAGSCEEGLELLTAIAALALSSFPQADAPSQMAEQPQPENGPFSGAASSEHVHEHEHAAREVTGPRPGRVDAAVSEVNTTKRWLLLASAGMVLDAATPLVVVVSGGGALTWGPGKLRLFARYGLPNTTEVSDAGSRAVRRDFAAVAIDYCYGLDRAGWLSLCGGLEQQTRRERRTERESAQDRAEESSSRRTALLGHAGPLFVLGRGKVQPQLELSWLMPLWGTSQGSAFRAELGAGLPF